MLPEHQADRAGFPEIGCAAKLVVVAGVNSAAKGAFDKKSLREDATAANGRCGGSGNWRAGLFDRWQ